MAASSGDKRDETDHDNIQEAFRGLREARKNRAPRSAAAAGSAEDDRAVLEAAVEHTLEKQACHLERLDKQLAQAVRPYSCRAIDSGSRTGTYEAIREIALEQAKGKLLAQEAQV